LAPFFHATASSKPACASIGRTNRWAPHTMWDSPIHLPGKYSRAPLASWTPPPPKLKNKQQTVLKQTVEGLGRMLN
jgi:hypothetical protein